MRTGTRIVVTGAGSVSPFGEGAPALWEGLLGGGSAIGPIDRFDTSGLRSHLAALVARFEPRKVIPPGVLRRLDRTSRLAVPAAAQALEQAGLPSRDRTGVILGTNSAGSIPVAEFLSTIAAGGPAAAPPILFPYTVANAPASQCALNLGLKGPNLTIVQKEGSSIGAITTACRMLRSGAAESLLAGGADDLSVHIFEAYDRLGVLSRDLRAVGGGAEGSRPFDAIRNGFVLGEGACFLVLEREDTARTRNRASLAVIEGTAEGRSPVVPHGLPESPVVLARVIERAVEAAGIEPGSIHAVFASADSSRRLDAMEAQALHLAFGGAVPPVCSVRGAIGQSGMAGAASAVAACFAIHGGKLPGTAGFETPDPSLGVDVSRSPREIRIERVLVTSFASGGTAMALVLAAP